MLNRGVATKLGLNNLINRLFSKKEREKRKKDAYDRKIRQKLAKRNKRKVFVIGFNKTGTTSIEHALKELGYILGDQGTAELLLEDVINNIFERLFDFTETAEAFQDIPFSLPHVFKILHSKYPDAHFILSIRDTPEQWYESISSFHSKVFGNGKIPTKEILMEKVYHYKGYPMQYIDYTFEGVIYEEEHYKKVYLQHLEEVTRYFSNNGGNLFTVNVSNPNDYKKMCLFLGLTPKRDSFQWKNKTDKTK